VYVEQAEATGSNMELFVDAGISRNRVRNFLAVDIPNFSSPWSTEPHLGIGARRRVSERTDLGVRLEADRADGRQLLSVRAVDYRYRWNRRLALNAFFGVGRYDVDLPAYGYYWGAGVQYLNILPKWDVGLDVRHHDKLGRDKTLPNDPPSTPDRTRMFFDVTGIAIYLSRRL
jgi:hypothetical protein